MDVGSNKSRKDARAVVSLVARYRSPSTFEYVQEACCDVSVGGMFIQSPDPAAAGTLLKLECEADKDGNKIRGVARVVWLRRDVNEYGPSGMGVKFVKLETGSKEIITRIVEQLSAAGIEAQSISSAPEARGKPPAKRITAPPTAAELSASAAGAGPSPAEPPASEPPKRKSDWPARPIKPAGISNSPTGEFPQLKSPPPPPPPPSAASRNAEPARIPTPVPAAPATPRLDKPAIEKPAVAAREHAEPFAETAFGGESQRGNTRRVFWLVALAVAVLLIIIFSDEARKRNAEPAANGGDKPAPAAQIGSSATSEPAPPAAPEPGVPPPSAAETTAEQAPDEQPSKEEGQPAAEQQAPVTMSAEAAAPVKRPATDAAPVSGAKTLTAPPTTAASAAAPALVQKPAAVQPSAAAAPLANKVPAAPPSPATQKSAALQQPTINAPANAASTAAAAASQKPAPVPANAAAATKPATAQLAAPATANSKPPAAAPNQLAAAPASASAKSVAAPPAAPATKSATPQPSAAAAPAPSPKPTNAEAAAAAALPRMPPANRSDMPQGQLPYVITFITRPAGANVTIGQQTVVAPGDIDLGTMPVRVKVVASKEGFQPTSAWLDRSDFVRSENVLRKRVYLTLPPITPGPATAAKVVPAAAPAPAKQ